MADQVLGASFDGRPLCVGESRPSWILKRLAKGSEQVPKSNTLNALRRVILNPKQFARELRLVQEERLNPDLYSYQQQLNNKQGELDICHERLSDAQAQLSDIQKQLSDAQKQLSIVQARVAEADRRRANLGVVSDGRLDSMCEYSREYVRRAETVATGPQALRDCLSILRRLPLDDFGQIMISMPSPELPRLSALLPAMASGEVQRSWTGADGIVLLGQTNVFARIIAQNLQELCGRRLSEVRSPRFWSWLWPRLASNVLFYRP